MTIAYGIPDGFARSPAFSVDVDGVGVPVGHTNPADFACFCTDGPVVVAVTLQAPVTKAVVRPLSRGIVPTVDGCRVSFRLDSPANVSVEVEGAPALFLFASSPERDVPSRNDPAVRWLEAGTVHDLGEVVLESGQTLYVEGGAVLRGNVVAKGAGDIAVRGRGIVDGAYWHERHLRRNGMRFED
jgi:hypothetical protein